MIVLTCYSNRRRLGAYLDRALPEGEAQVVAAHLDDCPACRSEAQDLDHVRNLVRQSVATSEPDWRGFWPGIVRGIRERQPEARDRRFRVPASRRLALAAALAASLLAVVVWRGAESPTVTEGGNVVEVADTEHPGGSVMVYKPDGDDMTVIWVFGLDNPGASTI